RRARRCRLMRTRLRPGPRATTRQAADPRDPQTARPAPGNEALRGSRPTSSRWKAVSERTTATSSAAAFTSAASAAKPTVSSPLVLVDRSSFAGADPEGEREVSTQVAGDEG